MYTCARTHNVEQCCKSSFSSSPSDAKSKKKKSERGAVRSLHYLVALVRVGDLQRLHGLDHGLHGGEDVLVDQPGEAPLVLVRVSAAMDDPHLLDESALPTFAGPCSRQTQTLVNMAAEKEPSRQVPLSRKRIQKGFSRRRNQ